MATPKFEHVSLFSRVIQFGGNFLKILVGNIIKIEKKMKDEATLSFVSVCG